MTTAHRGLKVKVKVMGQANAVGPTSTKGSFFLVYDVVELYTRVARKCDRLLPHITEPS